MTDPTSFRARIKAKEPLTGIFVKTAAVAVVELLGLSGLDFVGIDAEHGPFNLETLDAMAVAARAVGVPLMVRVPRLDPAYINSVLDLGAMGVIIPHIRSAKEAAVAAGAVKYRQGGRGYSAATRAARYGLDAPGYLERADAMTSLWCQIEDKEALGEIAGIAATPGVDCLFLGPSDLALSMGLAGPNDPGLAGPRQALAQTCRASSAAAGTYVSDTTAIASAHAAGYSIIICSTDQAALLQAGRAAVAAAKNS